MLNLHQVLQNRQNHLDATGCKLPVLQVYGGPSNHYWQDFTNKMLKGRKDNASVVKKLLLDNLVFSPVYNVLMMTYISAGAVLCVHLRGVSLAKSCLCCTHPELLDPSHFAAEIQRFMCRSCSGGRAQCNIHQEQTGHRLPSASTQQLEGETTIPKVLALKPQ